MSSTPASNIGHKHPDPQRGKGAIKWTGVYDLTSIVKSFELPILARAKENHYGNNDLSAFSKLDMLKIQNAVLVDLVLATFARTGKGGGKDGKHGDLTVDMDESSVQICFPKDFCGLFQLALTDEKAKKSFRNAKELAQHKPRLVKVKKCEKEFPEDVSTGDIIQIIGVNTEGGTSYLSFKRYKIGAELQQMSMKCKGQFELYIDTRHYSLSDILELYPLPVVVTLPKKSKQAMNVKSEVLSLLNHVGGTLTLQREVASEFFVASTTVHRGDNQTTVLVLSKNANVQFEVPEDMACEAYQTALESFPSVAIKGIPQELFISEHGMPFVACLNYRRHTKSMSVVPEDRPPLPPPRPQETIPEHLRESKDTKTPKGYGKIKKSRAEERLRTDDLSGASGDDSPIYERIKSKGSTLSLARSMKLEKARTMREQKPASDNNYDVVKQRTLTIEGNSVPSLSRTLSAQQMQEKLHPNSTQEGQFKTIPDIRRRDKLKPPDESQPQSHRASKVRQTHLLRSPSERQPWRPVLTPACRRPSLPVGSLGSEEQPSNTTHMPMQQGAFSFSTSSIEVNTSNEDHEDHYMSMNMNKKKDIGKIDKAYHHPRDSMDDPTFYVKKPPSSVSPESSYQREPSFHHQHQVATPPIRIHQFHRPESPCGDGYIKMDRGAHIDTREEQTMSRRNQIPFREKGYINSPRQLVMMPVPDCSETSLKPLRRRTQSAENLLTPPSPPPAARGPRSSLDLFSHQLTRRVSSATHYTLPRQHSQNLDRVYSPTGNNYAHNDSRYGHGIPSPTFSEDRVRPVTRYTTIPRFSTKYDDGVEIYKPFPKTKKKIPPPIPLRADDPRHELYGHSKAQTGSPDKLISGRAEFENTMSSKSTVKSHCNTPDDDEYSSLKKRDDVNRTDDLFPPPPSQEYLNQLMMATPDVKATPIIRRKRDIPRDIGNLSVSELSQCLRLMNIDSNIIEVLRKEQVDGTLLRNMTEDMIISLGVPEFYAKKVHLFSHDGWRPTSVCENNNT